MVQRCERWRWVVFLEKTTNIHYSGRGYKEFDRGSEYVKLEKILKGSLGSIPSPLPSVQIQIMGEKVCLRCNGKTLLGVVNKLLKTKTFFIDITQQCFAVCITLSQLSHQ